MRGATIFPLAVFDAGVVLEHRRTRADHRCCPGRRRSTSRCSTTPTAAERDISSLRLAVTGAADIPVELIRRVREELPFERILTGYGLTEAGTVTGSRPDDDFEHIADHGRRAVARLRGAHRDRVGRRRGAGEPGEVVVRGETVMRGLPRRPRGDRGRDRRRRLAAHRRPRHVRRRRLPAHRRAHQGHVHRRRVQRVPGRDREPAAAPPAHRAGRGDRRARRAPRRGRHGVRRARRRRRRSSRPRSSSGRAARWRTSRCRGSSSSSTRCR